ncbi:MAG: thermonuclease family protein [Synechococcaceae cyanobacterium SM2_3_60]|nr:thermonuclease family protein [Synechococcaceae cyanobacterium SM2_3_60]
MQLVGVEPPYEDRFGYFAGQYLQDIARSGIFLEIPGELSSEGVLQGYVWSGNTLVNEEMLMLGHGFRQNNAADSRYERALSEAVAVAQSQGRGIWNYYSPLMD